MRITYDGKADALYIAFGEGPATVQEVAEGIALDWDSEGRLLGIEIMDASKRLADPEATQALRHRGHCPYWGRKPPPERPQKAEGRRGQGKVPPRPPRAF